MRCAYGTRSVPATLGRLLAENDDIGPDNLNSRPIFNPPADGVYRILATSFEATAFLLASTSRKKPKSGVKPPQSKVAAQPL